MRKVLCFIISIMLILMALPYGLGESVSSTDSSIAWLMKLYGFDLSNNVIETMQESIHPQTFDCGSVKVTLQEVLYDGIWLYASATVMPVNPEVTLIMPGSATIGDFVSGGYQENLRDDNRTFQEAALQDEKELLCIYVHPVELEQAEYFFLDHRQDAGNQSTLFSGAPINGTESTLTINLSIRLDAVDLSSETYTQIGIYEFPVDVQRIGSVNSRTYRSTRDDTPLDLISLVQTPLSAYAFPEWKSGDNEGDYEFILLDEQSNPISRGAPPDGNTFCLPSLPNALSILIRDNETAQEEIVLFSAVEDEK